MKPYQERVVTEKQELDTKLEKLGAFIKCETFAKLSFMERQRLIRQSVHMKDYSDVLGERIAEF